MPVSFKPKHPTDILWRAPALVSTVLAGEGLALIMTLAPGYSSDRWVYFGLSSFMIQWVILLTLGSLYLVRNKLAQFPIHIISWLGLATLILSSLIVCSIFWAGYYSINSLSENDSLIFLLQTSAIALIVGLLGLIALQHYWRGHQRALANKQAELDMLQARIQPHFLFNTLNTVTALVHQRPNEAEQILLDLSELFRAALSKSKLILLEEELLLARRYLEIEMLRFGNRIRIHWQLPETIPVVILPALSIQPLVENAVTHGVQPNENGGDIEVIVQKIEGQVLIVVSNSLPETVTTLRTGHSIGLSSTRERIEKYSNGKSTVTTLIKNGRYVATISLPA